MTQIIVINHAENMTCVKTDSTYSSHLTQIRNLTTGKYATSGDWRYLIFNNLALLDSPGEYVCINNGDGTSDFSYIPPVGDENTDVVVSQLKTLIDMSQVTDFQLDGKWNSLVRLICFQKRICTQIHIQPVALGLSW